MTVLPPLSPDPAAPSRPERRARRPLLRLDERTVHVRPWIDPVVDLRGHDARSPYVEKYWLPVLGPSATVFLRHLAGGFDDAAEGYDLDLAEAAGALGMAGGRGATSSFVRMLARVQSFGFAQFLGGDTLVVRTNLPPLTRRQLERLPPTLQDLHDDDERAAHESTPVAAIRNQSVAPQPGGDAA